MFKEKNIEKKADLVKFKGTMTKNPHKQKPQSAQLEIYRTRRSSVTSVCTFCCIVTPTNKL